MNTKLTLSLDSMIIDSAKKNLQTKDKSLSRIIEDYFKALIVVKTRDTSNSPIVKELTGVAKSDKNTNDKETITDYLLEKYT